MVNPHINCSVNNCRYNDRQSRCTLSTINVGNTVSQPHNCCDTECDSFEEIR